VGETTEAGQPRTESVGTVIVAGGANLAVAVAKAVAGLLSGSSALLSEAAHPVADTTTEGLLCTALRRGQKAPDEGHPSGYGKESYVWAFLAALFTFVAGAGILARANVSLLVGQSVTDRLRGRIRDELAGVPTVDRVDELLTMQLGRDDVLVAARVDFADDASGAAIETAADDAERRLEELYPAIRYVFLDPTRGRAARAPRS
jgi:divalent metal cation (Fe/Co/Zn/Cd) transporter